MLQSTGFSISFQCPFSQRKRANALNVMEIYAWEIFSEMQVDFCNRGSEQHHVLPYINTHFHDAQKITMCFQNLKVISQYNEYVQNNSAVVIFSSCLSQSFLWIHQMSVLLHQVCSYSKVKHSFFNASFCRATCAVHCSVYTGAGCG